jgi:hypothetical protein
MGNNCAVHDRASPVFLFGIHMGHGLQYLAHLFLHRAFALDGGQLVKLDKAQRRLAAKMRSRASGAGPEG